MNGPTEVDAFRWEAHYADECNYERCTYCGCCAHGKTQRDGCKVDLAPRGMGCPGDGRASCGCEGRS